MKGVRTIGDMLKIDNTVYTLEELRLKYSVRNINFLNYHMIKTCNFNETVLYQKPYAYIPFYLQVLLKHKKGMRAI